MPDKKCRLSIDKTEEESFVHKLIHDLYQNIVLLTTTTVGGNDDDNNNQNCDNNTNKGKTKILRIVLRAKRLTPIMERDLVRHFRFLSHMRYYHSMALDILEVPGCYLREYPTLLEAIEDGIFQNIRYYSNRWPIRVVKMDPRTALAFGRAMETTGLKSLLLHGLDIRQNDCSILLLDGLKKSKTMESFSLFHSWFDFSLLCNAIDGHESLKDICIYTYSQKYSPEEKEMWKVLEHQTYMNRFGRAFFETKCGDNGELPSSSASMSQLSLWPNILGRIGECDLDKMEQTSVMYSFVRKLLSEFDGHVRSLR